MSDVRHSSRITRLVPRPGDAATGPDHRIRSNLEGTLDALEKDVNFHRVEQLAQYRSHACAAVRVRRESFQILKERLRNGLAAEFPDDRSQLWLGVKRQTVIDAPDCLVRAFQAMPALSVRVVGDQVEQGDTLKLLGERF